LKYETSKFSATRLAPNWHKWILPLFVLISLTACATAPKVITEFETVTIEVAVRTPLPDDLLADPPGELCFIPPTPEYYFFDLDQWAACLEGEVDFYARQLERIKTANKKPPEGG
jgi:hypothetical protein